MKEPNDVAVQLHAHNAMLQTLLDILYFRAFETLSEEDFEMEVNYMRSVFNQRGSMLTGDLESANALNQFWDEWSASGQRFVDGIVHKVQQRKDQK